MMFNLSTAFGLSLLARLAFAAPCFTPDGNASMTVNVGYTKYQGYFNKTTNLYSWEGIQYGHVERFQEPTTPIDLPPMLNAYAQGPHCSQFTAHGIGRSPISPGAEQCLFLNVYVPPELRCSNKSAPVVVWIHGGGYGYGYPDAFGTATNALNLDDGKTILVTIQYRLGVFGFLAGNEIHNNGNSNLGIFDQVFALKWVHQNIASFGGNPNHVTIWGESAGGGSMMMMTQAFGGALGNSYWQGTIANSPYLPIQYHYNDSVPQTYYDSMVALTGCAGDNNFTCLSNAPYETVFYAGSNLSQTLSPFGTWSANPVTDGRILLAPPSQALYPGKVNGAHMYAGHLTHEGHSFVPMNISTMADLEAWFDSEYPLVSTELRELVWEIYPEPQYSNGAYANQYERAATLYGDWTFRCPAYWLASSYPNGRGYKYIDNVGTAYHGSDLANFFNVSGVQYNEASSRNYILGSMTAFWQTWDPANNSAVSNLGWMPFDRNHSYSEITYQLANNSTSSPTFAYVNALDVAEPKECTFLRAIGPQIPA